MANNEIALGTTLWSRNNRYNVDGYFGGGAYGTVYRCWQNNTGKLVAIKAMEFEERENAVEIDLEEIKIAKILRQSRAYEHNIARFHESFYYLNNICLVFEFLERNLAEYMVLKNRRLPLHHIRLIIEQMLTALVKLKEMGLIHADLKPANIMLVDTIRQPFRVKLIDFGLTLPDTNAKAGMNLQTPYYRAPEILLGLPFNQAIDMWSLGCIAAELFLKQPLYPGRSSLFQMSYICTTQGRPPNWMLDSGLRTEQYFVQEENRSWRIWTREAGQPAIQNPNFVYKSLNKIWQDLDAFPFVEKETTNVPAALKDRKEFVNLIKRMLTIDTEKRIPPADALRHPFVTLRHFDKQVIVSPYVIEGMQCLNVLRDYKSSTSHNFRRHKRNFRKYK